MPFSVAQLILLLWPVGSPGPRQQLQNDAWPKNKKIKQKPNCSLAKEITRNHVTDESKMMVSLEICDMRSFLTM